MQIYRIAGPLFHARRRAWTARKSSGLAANTAHRFVIALYLMFYIYFNTTAKPWHSSVTRNFYSFSVYFYQVFTNIWYVDRNVHSHNDFTILCLYTRIFLTSNFSFDFKQSHRSSKKMINKSYCENRFLRVFYIFRGFWSVESGITFLIRFDGRGIHITMDWLFAAVRIRTQTTSRVSRTIQVPWSILVRRSSFFQPSHSAPWAT